MAKISDNRLQFLLDALCKRYNLNALSLVIDKAMLSHDGAIGEYQCQNNRIVIDNTVTDDSKIVAIYHEFRHYWQHQGASIECRDIYLWWMDSNNHDTYNEYYDYCVCSIEEDARAFGYSHGKKNREDLLDMYNTELLENMKSDGTLEMARDYLGYVDWHTYLK